MPYYKNYAASSGRVHNVAKHEDAVEGALLEEGFNKLELKISKNQRDAWLQGKTSEEIPNDSFICQPCGTHNSPDFIVKENNRVFFIECKSSKQTHPTYNSGLPDPNYIYIFCSSSTNETTFYLGKDVLDKESHAKITEYLNERRKIDDKFNDILSGLDVNQRGFSFYTRPMYNQKGKNKNYFTHPSRWQCEKKVLKHVM